MSNGLLVKVPIDSFYNRQVWHACSIIMCLARQLVTEYVTSEYHLPSPVGSLKNLLSPPSFFPLAEDRYLVKRLEKERLENEDWWSGKEYDKITTESLK